MVVATRLYGRPSKRKNKLAFIIDSKTECHDPFKTTRLMTTPHNAIPAIKRQQLPLTLHISVRGTSFAVCSKGHTFRPFFDSHTDSDAPGLQTHPTSPAERISTLSRKDRILTSGDTKTNNKAHGANTGGPDKLRATIDKDNKNETAV